MRSSRKSIFVPKNPSKYRGQVRNIVCRSSWEKIFCVWLDRNPAVLEWSSEEIIVPYYSPVDGQSHRYFVDFWLKYVDQDGAVQEKLVEIKPYEQCIPPTSKFSRGFEEKLKTYAVNQAKWEAASEYAKQRGWTFQVVTEKNLGI